MTTTDTPEYLFMERLITQSFPIDEYRDLHELRRISENNPNFYNNVVYDGDRLVGIITYWDLGKFYYVEHFAVDPEMRNGGYGMSIMATLLSTMQLPVVLEVERPTEEMAKRRIGFYQRCGFTLWNQDYVQPPYRAGGNPVDLLLMVHGALDEIQDFDHIKKKIHKEVYNYEE